MTTPNTPHPNNQWGAQPGPSQHPHAAQQPGQPYAPQWGAPQQGQPVQPVQPGQQWGVPQQPGQPGHQWGAPQTGPGHSGMTLPSGMPAWPTWAMLGLFLLSLLTSFFAIARITIDLAPFGSIGASANWWGSFNVEATGAGRYGKDIVEDAADGSALTAIATVVVLGCYVAATVLYFLRREKLAALLGVIGGAIQLLSVVIWLVNVLVEETASLAAGWWLWLLWSLIALPLSIVLLVRGRAGVDGKLATASSTGKAPFQGAQAQPFQPQQSYPHQPPHPAPQPQQTQPTWGEAEGSGDPR